jgi:hypothetical protein
MFDETVCDIQLSAITLWPPGVLRRVAEAARNAAGVAIVGIGLFGIAMGFAAVGEQQGTAVQTIADWAAVHTGLIR